MKQPLTAVIEQCLEAVDCDDAQSRIVDILLAAASDQAVRDVIAGRTNFSSLSDLIIHRSERLTLLAGSLPPGFCAAPHNHNLWSVVSVCAGQEDNEFYERDGDGLKPVGRVSIKAPGVLPNAADVIHAISNPLDIPLSALHAYGGDLLAVPRSNWDRKTNEEIPFDWQKVAGN